MPSVIKLGSVGPDVAKWKALLGAAGFPVELNNTFDAQTDQMTRAWQQQKHLLVDGIVGGASWATMTGQQVTQNTANLDRHKIGRLALQEAWVKVTGQPATLPELQIAGAQADIESGYGASSYKLLDHATSTPKNPVVLKSSGRINNWGAIQTDDPAHGFLATDTGPSHKSAENPYGYYDHLYRIYETSAEGAEHLVQAMTLKRTASWELMKKGDLDAWSKQMWAGKLSDGSLNRDPNTNMLGYFEQLPDSRAASMEKRIKEIAQAHGEPIVATRGGPPAAYPKLPEQLKNVPRAGVVGLVFAGVLAAIYWWAGRR